jgi:hypothetical protein
MQSDEHLPELVYEKLDNHSHAGGGAHHEEGEGPWLMSFADMVTLLMCFFILFFSIEKGNMEVDDPAKLKEILDKLSELMNVETPENKTNISPNIRSIASSQSDLDALKETREQIAKSLDSVFAYQDGLAGPEGDIVRDPRADLPTFREFFRAVKKAEPSGPLGEAFKISGAVRSMGRFVVAPPKTPVTAVEILRKGFRDTFDNPEFKAESERVLRFQLVSFVGEDAAKVNAAVFRAATGPVRDALRKMTQE